MEERPPTDESEISEIVDTVHDVLSNSYRRSVIARLADRGRPVDVETLASEVLAVDPGATEGRVSTDRRESAIVSLVHVHLPKLHETGFVNWNRRDGTVEIAPMVEQLSTTTPVAGSLVDASIDLQRSVEE